MSKRVAVAAMGALTGLLLFTAAETALVGGVFLAGAAYLLALPYIGEHQHGVERPPESRRT